MSVLAATSSAEQTQALAGVVAELSRPGDVIVLAGDLGAGKTAFTKGFGRGLGVHEVITSPTFTLAHQYEGGRLMLHHLDVYRLEHLNEVLDIGLPEMLDEGGVVVIEWGDAIMPVLPNDFLEIRLAFGTGDDDRTLSIRPVGPGWNARSRALTTALRTWAVAEHDG